MSNSYLCPICGQPYQTPELAQQCVKQYGQPEVKYSVGQRVITQITKQSEQIIGVIIQYEITKPVAPGQFKVREPHTVIYLLKVEYVGKQKALDRFIRTTVSQEEIKASQQSPQK